MVLWVKNLTAVALDVWVQCLAQYIELKDSCCHMCDVGDSCSSDSVPGQGIALCHGCGHLKKKKKHVLFLLLFWPYLWHARNCTCTIVATCSDNGEFLTCCPTKEFQEKNE